MNQEEKSSNKNVINSILHATQLLELIAKEKSAGISQLARQSGLKKTTVARTLLTLQLAGLVEQNPENQKFSLGIKMFEIGSKALTVLDIRQKARPFMESFLREADVPILLSVLSSDEMVYIDKLQPPHGIHLNSAIGDRAPLHCTASGKALLAFLADADRQQLIARLNLRKYTTNTIIEKKKLEEELAITRQRGFSIDLEERIPGIAAVGAPLFNYTSKVVASLSTPLIKARVSFEELTNLGHQLADLGLTISRNLGYSITDAREL